MKKKVIIVIVLSLVITASLIQYIFTHSSQKQVLSVVTNEINKKLDLINDIVDRFPIKSTGIAEVTANYKGAHGENYPAKFNYNYEVLDKIYFEDTSYSSIDNSIGIIMLFNALSNVSNLNLDNYKSISSEGSKRIIMYDNKYINEILGTNFKSVRVEVKTKGLIKRLSDIHVFLDDIDITLDNNDIKVSYDDKGALISLSDNAVYVNVNDKLKMNIFMKNDGNNFSIVLNDKVYSVQMSKNEANIKFSSPSSIYNSMSIKLIYKDVSLSKTNALENIEDNPVLRYLNEADLSL